MLSSKVLQHRVMCDPRYTIAFGFGSGLSPIVPGTMGTLAAVPFYLGLSCLSPIWYIACVCLALVIGGFLCEYISQALKVHDYKGIVWDEFVGYWITMFLAPVKWEWMVIGFFLFRFFDIVKMGPVRFCDRSMKNGWGIMLDDVFAGFFAFIILQLLMRV